MTSVERWDIEFWDNHSCQNEICDACWGKVEEMRQARDRLRGALERIAHVDDGTKLNPAADIARRALEGSGK